VALSESKVVVAHFTLKPVLSVGLSGTGAGTVTSDDHRVVCGNDCSEIYEPSEVLTLIAAAAPGSAFTGWSSACTGTSEACSVTMIGNRTVTASFALKTALTVTLAGNGHGLVTTSTDGGITCGTDCTESYAPSATITLNAAPSQGSAFDGWSGACTGQNTSCVVTMAESRSVSAYFKTVSSPPASGNGGGGGGGRLDWTVLALGAALLLLQLRPARRAQPNPAVRSRSAR
jgi:uncharacterized repeat protein (TIGR02543 family)